MQGTTTKPGLRGRVSPSSHSALQPPRTAPELHSNRYWRETRPRTPCVAKTRQNLWACSFIARNGSPDKPLRKGHRQDKWETRKGHDVPGHPSKMTALLSFSLDPKMQRTKRCRSPSKDVRAVQGTARRTRGRRPRSPCAGDEGQGQPGHNARPGHAHHPRHRALGLGAAHLTRGAGR